VSTLSFFQTNETAYIVMEYVEGATFKQHLEQQGGKIPFEAALKVLVQVMDALGALAATFYRAITGQVPPEAPLLGPRRTPTGEPAGSHFTGEIRGGLSRSYRRR
jgi:hypothetical protein